LNSDIKPSSQYVVLDSGHPDMALFFSLVNPSPRDRWWSGRRFSKPPQLPIKVVVRPDNEAGKILAYHNPVNLMSDALAQVVLGTGVDNLDLYEAVIVDEGGKVLHEGHKVFNLLGTISAADLQRTVFLPGESRLIDASFERLELDPDKTREALMFRLAQNVSVVVVHERVARAIEAAKFEGVRLTDLGDVIKA
jgi:hypothetical protein